MIYYQIYYKKSLINKLTEIKYNFIQTYVNTYNNIKIKYGF
jgi:hypothetical protein